MHAMHESNKPEFRFKLNGFYIPEIRIERALVHGEPVGKLQIAARDEWVGWIVVDDNSTLSDRHLAQFILEYRNETDWATIDPVLRRNDPLKGWRRVSPFKLMKVLHNAGLIDIPELRENQ